MGSIYVIKYTFVRENPISDIFAFKTAAQEMIPIGKSFTEMIPIGDQLGNDPIADISSRMSKFRKLRMLPMLCVF